MRTLIMISMVFSLSAMAQTRVRENIKQQAIAVDANGTSRPVKRFVQPKPIPPKARIKE